MSPRVLMLALALLVVQPALAQPAAWTAADAVSSALETPDLDGVLESRLLRVRAEVAAATAYSAPSLGFDHEQVFGARGIGYLEFSARVETQLGLSDWRGQLRAATPHRESAVRAEMQAWRLDVAEAVRTALYSVRHRQEGLSTLDAWLSHLEEKLSWIQARRRRGDASTYAVRRIERELQIGEARRAKEAALLAEAWAELERWVRSESPLELRGELAPDAAESSSAPPHKTSPELPEIARLRHTRVAVDAEIAAQSSPF